MKIDLPPLDYTPPPSGDVDHFRSALRRARARLNERDCRLSESQRSVATARDRLRAERHRLYDVQTEPRARSLEDLRDKQRITFSDRYPLREYRTGGTNEEQEPRVIEPRSADDIDNNSKEDL